MGNSFRRLLSVVLLGIFAVAIYRFVQQTGNQPGMAALVVRQALWIVLLIGGVLLVARWLRPRDKQ